MNELDKEFKEEKMSNETASLSADRVEPVIGFLYRDLRELFSESMKTIQEFSSKADLVKYLQASIGKYAPAKYDCSKLTIKKYGDGLDMRNGWDTHIVHLNGYGVLGFTSAPVED